MNLWRFININGPEVHQQRTQGGNKAVKRTVDREPEDRADIQGAGLTCGEIDVGKKDDVCGDEGDELRDADFFLKVDVNHVVISQTAVG